MSRKTDWLSLETRVRDVLRSLNFDDHIPYPEALARIDAIIADETGRGNALYESTVDGWGGEPLLAAADTEWTSVRSEPDARH